MDILGVALFPEFVVDAIVPGSVFPNFKELQLTIVPRLSSVSSTCL